MKSLIINLLFILGFLSPVFGQGLQPLDIARIQSVGDAQISEDAAWAAYTLIVQADPLKENKPARSQLYLVNLKDNQSIPFVTRGSVRQISFRPGHHSITFLNKLEGDEHAALYEISLNGGEARKLFSHHTSISFYEWSPDGKQLAFIAAEAQPEQKDSLKLPYEPIVYEANLQYNLGYLADPAKDERTPVKLEKRHLQAIHWSPDGKKLVIMSAPSPLVDDTYMKNEVVVLDAQSMKTIGKLDHNAKMGSIAWSPDGKKLAMIAGDHIHDPIDGRLLVFPESGGKAKVLQKDFKGMFEDFEWIDDNTIQFLASEGVESFIGTITADGTQMQRLTVESAPNIIEFDRAGDGTCVLVADSPQHPAELYILEKARDNPNRVTTSNPWLKDVPLGKQEVVRFKARDGMEIEGILIRPLNEKPGERYPLITIVHGGPEAHFDNGWLTRYSNPGQMAAARGIAAFYPNYRGSTGRGLEFAMSSQGDLAGKEFDDIVDGVDYLIQTGLVDKDKVGVTGGSYGGYATGWLCTRYTDRFAAGVMFVGISNNISKWGTSDIPEELYLVHSRKRIWEDYEGYLKRSPIYYADQTKTPMLIMHGMEDPRVHPGQSLELYRHIKTRTNTPVKLVLYPGEGHGNRNATARLDYTQRQMEWFETYLKKEVTRP